MQPYIKSAGLLFLFLTQLAYASSVPTLLVDDKQVAVGDTLEFTIAPIDEDGVVPGVFMQSGPSGATLTDNGDGTRNFNWSAVEEGSYTVVLVVVDGQDATITNEYTINLAVGSQDVDSQIYTASLVDVATATEATQANTTNITSPVISPLQDPSTDLPGYLASKKEPLLDTQFMRVTERGLFEYNDNSATHRYSKRQAWNSNETLLEVEHKILDARTFTIVHNAIPLGNERAWSATQPNIMVGIAPIAGKYISLAYHDFASGKTTTVKNFDEFEHCTMGDGEGNPSNDGSRVLLVCNGYPGEPATAISVELPTGQVLGVQVLELDYNWAGFSQTGEHILVEYSVLGNSNFRLVRFAPDLTEQKLFLTHDVGHGDFGIDVDGNDVYVMIDHTGIYYIRLHDGLKVHIGSTDSGVGLGFGHVSCRNIAKAGWCFYSSSNYGTIGEFELSYNQSLNTKWVNGHEWQEGTKNFVHWGHGRSSSNHYDAHPKASVSPSGTQIIYSSDWFGQNDVHSFVSKRLQQ